MWDWCDMPHVKVAAPVPAIVTTFSSTANSREKKNEEKEEGRGGRNSSSKGLSLNDRQ